MSTTSWVGGLVAVIIIAGGAWWYVSTNNQQAAAPQAVSDTGSSDPNAIANGGTGVSVDAGATVTTPKTVTVTYNGDAFSPSTITINIGDTVKFVTTGNTQMWLASDPHPAHTSYDGTSRTEHCAAGYTGPKPLDECGTGTSFSFTFTKVGSFGYHDHRNDNLGGTVIVN